MKRQTAVELAALCICLFALESGSETYKMITYYPAPYGSYAKFRTTGLTMLAQSGGRVTIGVPAARNEFADNKLEIGGIMILSKNISAPDTINGGGGLRWNGMEMQYNNGSQWQSLGGNLQVLMGSNPSCPAGQKALMHLSKSGMTRPISASCSATRGVTCSVSSNVDVSNMWFAPGAVSGWSAVLCGAALSADGTSLLVNYNHSAKDCTAAGGVVASDGAGNSMCKFTNNSSQQIGYVGSGGNGFSPDYVSIGACPSGWTQYQSWSETPNVVYYDYEFSGPSWGYSSRGSCTVTGHPFSNNAARETCSGHAALPSSVGCY